MRVMVCIGGLMALMALAGAGRADEGRPAERAVEEPAALEPDRDLLILGDPYCPYSCDPTSGTEGYMVELVRAIFEPQGYTVSYRMERWSHALRLTEQGHADLLAVVGQGRGREGLLFPARPQGRSQKGVASLRGRQLHLHTVEELAAYRVAIARGYLFGPPLDGYIETHENDPVRITLVSGFGAQLTAQSLRLLDDGEVDLVLDDVHVLDGAARRLGLAERLAVQPLDGAVQDVFVGVSRLTPEAQDLVRRLEEGIAVLRADGRLARILGRYGLSDWETARPGDRPATGPTGPT